MSAAATPATALAVDLGVGRFRLCISGGRVGLQQRDLFTIMDAVTDHLANGGIGLDMIDLGEGEAAGADRNSRKWGEKRRVGAISKFPIDETLDGHDSNSVGKNRNSRMLRDFKPHVCLGFPGHGGTNDMLAKCHDAGVLVWEVEVEGRLFKIIQWPRSPGERSTPLLEGKL